MLFVRGILFVFAGLVLAGCMQSGPVFDANFTARDKQQLANPPYQQAWISPAYRRQIVDYPRKEAPGTILVDTDARYVYYVLPQGKAVRYGAIVGENGQGGKGTPAALGHYVGKRPTCGARAASGNAAAAPPSSVTKSRRLRSSMRLPPQVPPPSYARHQMSWLSRFVAPPTCRWRSQPSLGQT